MKNPLITVYITNFNYGKYLEIAVNSVLEQTLQDFELIIIDDGSTDNSKEVLHNFSRNDRIKIIYQQNKGLTISNNIALRLARGKYIIRLDADDYFDKNALSILSSVMETNENIGMVFADWYLMDEQGNVTGIERRHDFSRDVRLFDQPAHGACTMFRTQALREIGGYDETLSRQDGYELWFRYINQYEVQNLNVPLFYYRQHGSSLTKDQEKLLEVRSKIYKKHGKLPGQNKKTFSVMPIRGHSIDERDNPFVKLNDKFLIDYTIEPILDCEKIDKLVISTPDEKIIDYIKETYSDSQKIIIHQRSREIAKVNIGLEPTLNTIFNDIEALQTYDSFFINSIETPFKKVHLLESAVHVMNIFKVDTVIGVKQSNNLIFKHDGKGLKTINYKNSILRLERDNLYEYVSGYTLRKTSDYLKTGNIFGTKIGHIIVDQKSAHHIRSQIDIEIAQKVFLVPN